MQKEDNRTTPGGIRSEVTATGRHSLVYVTGQALSRAIGFFMIPLYTRFIAPGEYGVLELIEISVGILTIIISCGISEGLSRFYYAEKTPQKRNKVVSTVVIGLGMIGGILVFTLVFMSGPMTMLIFGDEEYRYFLQVAIVSAWFAMLYDLGLTYLRMLYKAKLFVLITTSQLLLAVSLNIWFIVYCGLGILGILYSTFITQGLGGLLVSAGILYQTGTRFSSGRLREIVMFGLPLVPSRIGVMAGFMSNRFFLRWLTPLDPAAALTQIGLFSLGHKFGVIINRLVNAPFNSFWVPRRMELLLSEDKEARRTVARICTYAVACLCYIALLLSAGVESLIEIMADPRYQGAHVVVPFVALSYVLLGLEVHFNAGIMCVKKTKWVSYITLVSVPVVLLWNYFLIPVWGIIGAATSNLAGGVLRVILIYAISQRLFPVPYELGRLARIFAACLVLYALAMAVNFSSPWSTFLVRIAIALTLPLALLATGFYCNGELAFLREKLTYFKARPAWSRKG